MLNRRLMLGDCPDVIVNMGTIGAIPHQYKGVVLNKPAAISHSSNKRRARQTFEQEGIPAPKLWTAGAIPRDVYPLVGRTTKHSKGKGFWFCRNHIEAERANRAGATHFIKFIENTREFRVHIVSHKLQERTEADYASIKMSEKVFEGIHQGQKTDVMKNRDNGWVFKHPSEISGELLANLRAVAKKSVAKFDLEWGAVDIMVDKDTDELYVLEINSSPRLTDAQANTVDKYADWVLHLAGIKQKEIKVVAKKAPPKASPYKAQKKAPVYRAPQNNRDMELVRNLFNRVGF